MANMDKIISPDSPGHKEHIAISRPCLIIDYPILVHVYLFMN